MFTAGSLNYGLVQSRTGRKEVKFNRNSAYTPCLQKSFVNSKAFGVKPLRVSRFKIILREET
jgi:hypothetical protein